MGGKVLPLPPPCPWVVLKVFQCCVLLNPYELTTVHSVYCRSLVTSCCTLLACANAAMPVWLRISYFDMFDVADA